MIPDKAIELLTQEKLTWIDLADNDDVYWTAQDYIDAYEMAIEAIKNAELYEQIKWERDVALAQLRELGLSLGEQTSDKYRWHDLRKNPEDLPNFWEYVLIHTHRNEVYVAFTDANYHSWVLRDDEFDYCDIGSSMVKAWQEIEPFAGDTNVGHKEEEE